MSVQTCEVRTSSPPWLSETCPEPAAYDVDLAPYADERHGWVHLCAHHTARVRSEIHEPGVILAVRTHR